MSALDKFKLYYEELPFKIGIGGNNNIKTAKRGGKDIKKMSKETTTKAKSYKKTRGEHIKDLVIAILISAIIAFVVGTQYANNQNAKVSEAVSAVESAQIEVAETPAKK